MSAEDEIKGKISFLVFFHFLLSSPPSCYASGQSVPRVFHFETRVRRIRVYTVWKCYESLKVSCNKQRKNLNVGATFLRWLHFHYRNYSHQWTKAFVSAFPRMDIFIKLAFASGFLLIKKNCLLGYTARVRSFYYPSISLNPTNRKKKTSSLAFLIKGKSVSI